MKYKNKHTGEILRLLRIDVEPTGDVYVLSDNTRWESEQFLENWTPVENQNVK